MAKARIPRDPNNPAYVMIPDELRDVIPKLYATEKVTDPIVHVKLFTPDSSWTWFLIEYDPDEKRAFALVVGLETELGYVDLSELEDVRGPMGLPIERDLSWQPKPLSVVRKDLE